MTDRQQKSLLKVLFKTNIILDLIVLGVFIGGWIFGKTTVHVVVAIMWVIIALLEHIQAYVNEKRER